MRELQEIRVALNEMQLKKSGENKFANFKYYELADFLPEVQELLYKKGLIAVFSIENNESILSIRSSKESASEANFVQFKAPFIIPCVKGANDVQNLGAAITYMRRYLYMMAFEIVEPDISDATLNILDTKPNKPKTQEDSLDPVAYCTFGKNKGVLWHTMSVAKLQWYQNHLIERKNKTEGDKKAINGITEILEQKNKKDPETVIDTSDINY